MVLVQFRVKVPDVDRFRAAADRYATDHLGDDFNRDADTEGLEWEPRIRPDL